MEILNQSSYAADIAPLGLPGGDLYNVLIVKASFRVDRGRLLPDPEPFPVWSTDQNIDGRTFLRDYSLEKEGVDLVILGDAVAANGRPTSLMNVKILLGSKSWTLVVFGDREWKESLGGPIISRPRSFTRMPLDWDHAYGGSAKNQDGENLPFMQNPNGRGYIFQQEEQEGQKERKKPEEPEVEGVPLPNIESPNRLIKQWNDQPIPAGCAYYPMHWGLRAEAGLEVGDDNLPVIKPALFNQAHPDFVLDKFPAGEMLEISGMTESEPFVAPIVAPPVSARVQGANVLRPLEIQWDTICVLPEESRLFLVGRAGFLFDPEVDWEHIAVVSSELKEVQH